MYILFIFTTLSNANCPRNMGSKDNNILCNGAISTNKLVPLIYNSILSNLHI